MNTAQQNQNPVLVRLLDQHYQLGADLADAYEELERIDGQGQPTYVMQERIEKISLALRGVRHLLNAKGILVG